MTNERREFLYSNIKVCEDEFKNQNILKNFFSDKALEDLYKIDKMDTSKGRRFFKNYVNYILNGYIVSLRSINIEDINESCYDSTKFKEAIDKYYVKVMRNFEILAPTYIRGKTSVNYKGDTISICDRSTYPEILKYMQGVYMDELQSKESKEVFSYVIKNDFPGLVKYFADEYNDIRIDILEKAFKKIKFELRYISGIYYIAKSPVSIYRIESKFSRDYTRYIKETGIKDIYTDMHKNNHKKSESEIAIIAISEFIENKDYTAVSYFYEDKYPDRNQTYDVKLVKEFDPDLYLGFAKKVETNSKIKYAILCNTGRKLKDSIIQSRYKLSIIDFLKIYNPETLASLINYYRNTIKKLPQDIFSVLNSYLRRINMSPIDLDDVMKARYVIRDKELSKEEKEMIINFIKDNKLPYMYKLFCELYRGYLTGELDLSIPFNEWE